MSTLTATRLAWSLWAVAVALVVGGLLLGVANRPEVPLYGYWFEVALTGPTFATLGALIVSRRPGNVIGWIFLVCGFLGGVQLSFGQYAVVALSSEGPSRLPGGAVAGWTSTLVQGSFVVTTLFLLLLFPTGRLPSPRWRPFALFVATTFLVFVVSSALMPGPLEDFAPARNPFGVQAAAAVLVSLDRIGGWMGLACVVAMVASLVWRFYRSRGEERLQMKWFVYAATLGIVALLLGDFLVPVAFRDLYGALVWTMAPLGLPVAATVAILRYRLYDIDLLINRTIVYATLTGTLAVVYVGGVVTLQYAFRALTGNESQLAIVASTLAIAALFVPLRRRVRAFVDRLFYRRKYDAAKTLAAFSSRLRDETDLERLGDALASVAKETVQPAHVCLWLRQPGQRAQEGDGPRDGRDRGGRAVDLAAATSDASPQSGGGRA